MKAIQIKFLAISSGLLLMLAACKKEGTLVTSNGGIPGTLTASTTSPVLDKTKLTDQTPVISFNFTQANYGFSAAVTNTLQIDVPGDNWKTPATAVLPIGTFSQAYSTAVFNNLVLKLNLPAGVASQVVARVAHSISSNITPVYSNTVTLTVTPFNLTSWLYITGAFANWQNPGPLQDSLISPNSNGIYTGIINFNGSGSEGNQFLILPAKKWDHKYATNDPKTQVPSTTVAYDGPNNFVAPSKTTVDPSVNITTNKVTIDINKNTISLVPTQWSVVGDATPGGWPNGSGTQSDTDLKYNNSTQTWSVVVALKPGGLKFRLNHDWTTNYGSVTTAGVLDTNNNNNIPITVAGNYLITVDFTALTYSIVKQ